jgi:hypothetical protein
MPDRMDKTDRIAAKRALVGWFEAQRIDPLDAALLMSHVIGEIIARLSHEDQASRSEALAILMHEMRSTANDY